MNTFPIIITVVVVLVLIGLLLGMSFARRKRAERLHDQYGPEYDRTVKTLGDEKKAQAELIERQKHVEAAADISVNYPDLVSNYRAARVIALKNDQHIANTEELRQAMIYFRSLFEELLETEADVVRRKCDEWTI